MFGPVVWGLSLLASRVSLKDVKLNKSPPDLGFFKMTPWFFIGFLLVAALRSLGMITTVMLKPFAIGATILTTVSIATLRFGVDVKVMAEADIRVVVAVTASLIVFNQRALSPQR